MHKRIIFCLIVCMYQLCPIILEACTPPECKQSWWIQGELLYWWIKKDKAFIPLVTSATLTDTLPGALGQPGTKVQLSSCSVIPKAELGFRVLIGTTVNEDENIDLEASYFLLPSTHTQCSVTTSGESNSINLAVPVYDTTGVW